MKVRSEDLSKVRFPEGRRGYDADKVDAVLSEIIETLREYEAADEALHRTFVEAQRIKDEIIGEARAEADDVKAAGEQAKAAAQIEADKTIAAAEADADKARAAGEQAKAEARTEADKMIAAAKDDAARQRAATEENVSKAKAEIERRLADADSAAADTRRTAEEDAAGIRAEARKDAENTRVTAAADAHTMVSDAKKESTAMLTEAKAEHAALSKKVPQLRTAVSDIRARLIELAESAQNELGVVDGMIDLAAEEAVPEIVNPSGPADEPAPEEQAEAAEAEEASTEPVEITLQEEPVVEVDSAEEGANATAEMKAKASDLHDVVPPDQSKETFYGSGLRRRLTEGTKVNKGS